MSTNRLTSWLPSSNYVYNDLNRPKPNIYKGRYLQHDGSSHFINNNHWSRKSSRTTSRTTDIITGLRKRDANVQVPSRSGSRYSDIGQQIH